MHYFFVRLFMNACDSNTKFTLFFRTIEVIHISTNEEQKLLWWHIIFGEMSKEYGLGTLQVDRESPNWVFHLTSCTDFRLCLQGHFETHFFSVDFQWRSSTGGFSLETKSNRCWERLNKETERRTVRLKSHAKSLPFPSLLSRLVMLSVWKLHTLWSRIFSRQ